MRSVQLHADPSRPVHRVHQVLRVEVSTGDGQVHRGLLRLNQLREHSVGARSESCRVVDQGWARLYLDYFFGSEDDVGDLWRYEVDTGGVRPVDESF